MSDEDELYIKVVVLDEMYNFVVQTFFNLRSFGYPNTFIWNNLSNENYVWFLKFKIWIFQTTSDGEMPKTKVVDLKKLCNFVVDNFFIWNHLVNVKCVWISEIWNSNFVNDLG